MPRERIPRRPARGVARPPRRMTTMVPGTGRDTTPAISAQGMSTSARTVRFRMPSGPISVRDRAQPTLGQSVPATPSTATGRA